MPTSPSPLRHETDRSKLQQTQQQLEFLRAFRSKWLAGNLIPLAKKQSQFPRDLPGRGPFWFARSAIPAAAPTEASSLHFVNKQGTARRPGQSLVGLVYRVFDELRTSPEQKTPLGCDEARSKAVPVEWIGYRSEVAQDLRAKELQHFSEADKFRALDEEWRAESTGITVLHVHGGGFYAGSPATFRSLPTYLASSKGCRARVCSTSYRLAPQQPFPAALIDVLSIYISLLSPSAGALHSTVDPKKLVLAGDSAGANLCLGLIQVLLHLQRQDGDDLPQYPLPAGVVLTSPWLDLTATSASWSAKNSLDILEETQPPLLANFPADAIWPSDPPRGHPYVETSALDHPLVSPAAATDWQGSPPIWLGVGGAERARDGVRAVACKAKSQGVDVTYVEYENMPHDFAITLGGKVPQAEHCLKAMAEVATNFVNDAEAVIPGLREVRCDAKLHRMPDCKETSLEWSDLGPKRGWEADVRRMRADAEEQTRRGPWEGASTRAKAKM